jgi:hypothetical protein
MNNNHNKLHISVLDLMAVYANCISMLDQMASMDGFIKGWMDGFIKGWMDG